MHFMRFNFWKILVSVLYLDLDLDKLKELIILGKYYNNTFIKLPQLKCDVLLLLLLLLYIIQIKLKNSYTFYLGKLVFTEDKSNIIYIFFHYKYFYELK